MDNSPPGRNFGDVLIAPLVAYKAGDSAVAQFVAANPRVGNWVYLYLGTHLIRAGCRIT